MLFAYTFDVKLKFLAKATMLNVLQILKINLKKIKFVLLHNIKNNEYRNILYFKPR